MIRNWTFGRILSVGYALAALVLILVAVVGYQSTSSLIENNEIVDRTHQQRRDLAELSARLTDAEAGMRGYVITGSTSFLAPYEGARERVRSIFGDLRGHINDPGQLRRLEALWPLIEARLVEAQRAVRARRDGGLEAGMAVVASETGKNLMDQIRAGVGELDRAAVELLSQREQIARSSARWTEGVILWGGIAGLILVAAAGWFTVSLLTSKVGRAVGQVESSSAELQAAANQQATGAKEQASAMNEIATTIRELIATSRQIAESSQKVAQVADDTDASARAGEETVAKANQSIGGIRHQVDLIVSHMLDLGKKSQQIGSVLDIVSELAEQTHILAVNATIEAAGAGESGKRFGVVADEIRKLSDRVAGSTKEIRGLIDDVRAAVNTTVMVTESGSKAVDAGSRQFEEVASSFKRISSMVSTTTEAAKEIELSTKQQSTAVEQVDVATSNVAQATKETEASSGQILETASELAELSRDLARLIRSEARA